MRHVSMWKRRVTPEQIKAARKFLGLTQAQMAIVLGYYGQSPYARMERGERAPHGSVIRLINAYLDGYRPGDWPTETH